MAELREENSTLRERVHLLEIIRHQFIDYLAATEFVVNPAVGRQVPKSEVKKIREIGAILCDDYQQLTDLHTSEKTAGEKLIESQSDLEQLQKPIQEESEDFNLTETLEVSLEENEADLLLPVTIDEENDSREESSSDLNKYLYPEPFFTPQGQRRWPCLWPGCKSSMTRRRSLKNHLRYHAGVKRFRCNWPKCKRSFIMTGDLQKHTKRHEHGLPTTLRNSGRRTNKAHNGLENWIHVKEMDGEEEEQIFKVQF